MNGAIHITCAILKLVAVVKELNSLYPSMDISTFLLRSGMAYLRFRIGNKGICTNSALLGRCLESCPYKHIACLVVDEKAQSVNEALNWG
jgi:hypothetical protein